MLQLLLALGHSNLLHDLGLQGAHGVCQWHCHAQHLSVKLPFRLVLNDRNNNCEGDWSPILGEEHVLRNKGVFSPGTLVGWLLLPPLHARWDISRCHAGSSMTHWNHGRESGRPEEHRLITVTFDGGINLGAMGGIGVKTGMTGLTATITGGCGTIDGGGGAGFGGIIGGI